MNETGGRFVVYFWSNGLHPLVVHVPQMLLPFFVQNFGASGHCLTIHIHDWIGGGLIAVFKWQVTCV